MKTGWVPECRPVYMLACRLERRFAAVVNKSPDNCCRNCCRIELLGYMPMNKMACIAERSKTWEWNFLLGRQLANFSQFYSIYRC